jgi:hypothetical protein
MMKVKFLCAVIALAVLGASNGRANTVFAIHDAFHIANTVVDGTITTDGNVGILGASDIVAWDLTVRTAVQSFRLTEEIGYISLVGSNLTATPTALLFNYDAVGYLQILGDPPGDPWFPVGYVYLGYFAGGFAINTPLSCGGACASEQWPAEFRSGIDIIGEATPLPAALPLFAGGVGLIGLLACRRRQRRTNAFA